VPFVKPGLPAEVTVPAIPGLRLACKITRVGFAVNEKNGTMRIEIDVPNPGDRLRPGMAAVTAIRLKVKDLAPGAVAVPASAVERATVRRGGQDVAGDWVYVVRDGKAHLTPVRVGARESDDVEILSGLRTTDLVVAHPLPLEIGGDPVPVAVK